MGKQRLAKGQEGCWEASYIRLLEGAWRRQLNEQQEQPQENNVGYLYLLR